MSAQVFSIPSGLVAWPSGVTSIFGFVEDGTSVVGLAGNGDGGINLAFGGGNLATGGDIVIRVTGSYSTDAP